MLQLLRTPRAEHALQVRRNNIWRCAVHLVGLFAGRRRAAAASSSVHADVHLGEMRVNIFPTELLVSAAHR